MITVPAEPGRGMETLWAAVLEYGCQPRGSLVRFRCVCPAHESHGSLTMAAAQGRRGATFWCHAGCLQAEILAELGLAWSDVFDQDRERTPDWRPRPRRTEDPVAELRRVLTRAVSMINAKAAQEAWRKRHPAVPSLSADERIALAEWAEKRDQDAHFWRVWARWCLLACDEKYVREAYEQRALWLRTGKFSDKPSDEQSIVLNIRVEDLQRQAAVSAA